MKIALLLILFMLSGCSFICPRDYSTTIYTVRPGDTLEEISVRFYGSELQMRLIMEANYLKEKGRLRKGQRLKIPRIER